MRGVRRGPLCCLASYACERHFLQVYLYSKHFRLVEDSTFRRISFRSLPRKTLGNLTRRGSPSRKELSTLGSERCTMALFVDRYRPKTLDDLDYHPELSSRLRALVSCSLPFALLLSAPAQLTSAEVTRAGGRRLSAYALLWTVRRG